MKNILKKLMVYVTCAAIILVTYGNQAFAKDLQTFSNENFDFFSKFYSKDTNIAVINSKGDDVTSWFLGKTQNLFENNRIEEIKDIIAQEEVVLHIITYKTDNMSRAYDKFKSVRSDMICFYRSDQNNATRIGVNAELVGGIWYNEATSQVTKVSNATYNILSIDTNTGLSVMTNNFKTGSSVQEGKGYFWGSCGFYSQGITTQNGVPYETYLDYGSQTVSFYAAP